MDLEAAAFEGPDEFTRKLLKAVEGFQTYIRRNRDFIPNYGERYQHGERISAGFVESVVNQVVSKRMARISRCSGASGGHICCCWCEPASSTRSGKRPSALGIPAFGAKW